MSLQKMSFGQELTMFDHGSSQSLVWWMVINTLVAAPKLYFRHMFCHVLSLLLLFMSGICHLKPDFTPCNSEMRLPLNTWACPKLSCKCLKYKGVSVLFVNCPPLQNVSWQMACSFQVQPTDEFLNVYVWGRMQNNARDMLLGKVSFLDLSVC